MTGNYPTTGPSKQGLGAGETGYVEIMSLANESQTMSCWTQGCTCNVDSLDSTCDTKCDEFGDTGSCPCGHPDCEAVDGLEIAQSVFDPHTVAESLEAPTSRLDVDPPSDVR